MNTQHQLRQGDQRDGSSRRPSIAASRPAGVERKTGCVARSTPESQVRAALDYYAEYREEIDGLIALNQEEAEQLHERWARQRRAAAG